MFTTAERLLSLLLPDALLQCVTVGRAPTSGDSGTHRQSVSVKGGFVPVEFASTYLEYRQTGSHTARSHGSFHLLRTPLSSPPLFLLKSKSGTPAGVPRIHLEFRGAGFQAGIQPYSWRRRNSCWGTHKCKFICVLVCQRPYSVYGWCFPGKNKTHPRELVAAVARRRRPRRPHRALPLTLR